MEYTRNLLSAVPSLVPRARAPRRPTGGAGGQRPWQGLSRALLLRRRTRGRRRRKMSPSPFKGRTLGIVGESGSGKSTVARASCGSSIRLPAASALAAANRRPLAPTAAAAPQAIQIIFQDPYRSLNPRITVGETIAEGPINFGCLGERALTKARELLELVDLPADAMSRYPHEFSGGQRQRIAIRGVALDRLWSRTRRSRRSTSRFRRRCWNCSTRSRPVLASRCCSLPTI